MKKDRNLLVKLSFMGFGLLLLLLTYKSWRETTTGVLERVLPASVIISSGQQRNYVAFDLENLLDGEVVHNAIGPGQPYKQDGLQIDLLVSDFKTYAEVKFESVDAAIQETVRLSKDKPRVFGENKMTVTGFVVNGE